jgi:AraC-like DNA-binding protein
MDLAATRTVALQAARDAGPHRTEPLREVESVLTGSPAVSRFETREPERAVEHMVQLYGPHELQLLGRHPIEMRVRGFELANLHVHEIRYGSSAVASMSQAHPHWVFSYLRHGTARLGRGGEVVTAGSAGVNRPDAVVDLVMSDDMELVNLRVSEHDMRNACSMLIGHEPTRALRFEAHSPAGTRHIATLLRLMDQLASTPRYLNGAAARFERSVRDSVLFELLLAWPNNAAQPLDMQPVLPATTRRARDYIHAHAAELPTVSEVAAACGVGVRALARGFEKHLGTSPLRYMQDFRLDRVREHLLAAPDDATVTRIALDWGFLHLGSFAVRYRERFGETPSQTLRRPRPR